MLTERAFFKGIAMARKNKNIVDYFPLYCTFGDDIEALEDKFGNDAFVVWVKTLQKLGKSDNHFIDCRKPKQWFLYYSKLKIEENKVIEILNELSELDCIDKKLWSKKIIYSQNFVDNVREAYKRRKTTPLTYDEIHKLLFDKKTESSNLCIHNADINAQNKPEKTRENEIRENNPPVIPPQENNTLNGEEVFLKFSKSLSGIIENSKILPLFNALVLELGNKKYVQKCVNDWLLGVYNHGGKTIYPIKSLLSYARKNLKKYGVLKCYPQETQCISVSAEIKKNTKKFVPFDVDTKAEAIDYIQKNFPPYQRGRTYGQKILIEKFKLKPEEYA